MTVDAELLSRLVDGDDSGLLQMIDGLVGDDPVGRFVLSRLQLRHAESADEVDEDLTEAPSGSLDDPMVAATLTALYDEVETLRHINDRLAEALGACLLCWGEHSDCPSCSGQGHPGWHAPEGRLFAELVAPAGRRRQLDLHRGRPRVASGFTPTTTTDQQQGANR